ncbi:SCO family protein [Mariniblastus fucicola]|nr:SCO family protein [Mariniblastus fucicola]
MNIVKDSSPKETSPKETSPKRGPNMLVLGALAVLACTFLGIAVVIGLMTTKAPIAGSGNSNTGPEPSADNPPGAVIVDVPWDHLHHIDSFEMKNQDGEKFSTAQFSGEKPYLVSFFFASCPSICRDLNKQVASLNEQLKKEDVAFVTITVDPDRDTPEVLSEYAQGFDAVSPRWTFLTGQQYKIKQVGEQMFRVEVVDMANHTDNIMLVDKWGKYRDRFKWDDPYDMKRLVNVVKEVAAETKPPLGKTVRTRNAMVGREPIDLSTVQYLREFHLYTSEEKPFFSRDLTGEVWIANFFFTSCPTICKLQSKYIEGLQNRLGEHPTKLVSITTDPVTDIPATLREYARDHNADPDRWIFLTGNEKVIPRVGSEFFSAMGGVGHHSTELFVVDKWGNVRGRFDWQDAAQEVEMLSLVDSLWNESRPPGEFKRIDGGSKQDESEFEEEDDE